MQLQNRHHQRTESANWSGRITDLIATASEQRFCILIIWPRSINNENATTICHKFWCEVSLYCKNEAKQSKTKQNTKKQTELLCMVRGASSSFLAKLNLIRNLLFNFRTYLINPNESKGKSGQTSIVQIDCNKNSKSTRAYNKWKRDAKKAKPRKTSIFISMSTHNSICLGKFFGELNSSMNARIFVVSSSLAMEKKEHFKSKLIGSTFDRSAGRRKIYMKKKQHTSHIGSMQKIRFKDNR